MSNEIETAEKEDIVAATIYESMGGYSPTIGIIGAVMGLIQVMGNLNDPSKLGAGIAIAFVATIYGVAFANLALLPISQKLNSLIEKRSRYQTMLIDGLVSIAEGEHPTLVKTRVSTYL